MISYQVSCPEPASHTFLVSMRIEAPAADGQVLRLPNWIPGSYMIRDFSRHIVELGARSGDREIALEQLDKSNWRAAPCDGPLVVDYRVYAKDLSVRAAYLDHTRGYFNGSSLFLEAHDQSEVACEVLIEKPPGERYTNWRLATTLARLEGEPFQFGRFGAAGYAELIDHPVEMGDFEVIGFEACGVPHDIVLAGRFECDRERLAHDLAQICETHIRFFGEPAPVDYYQFQTLLVGDGYGGLEHRSSTSLVASRKSLPLRGQTEIGDDYREFLGFCSHEYFHTWNVKRLRPQEFIPLDLQAEVYTGLLWAFEGITSYYDDLALRRAGLIDAAGYLELLARTMTRVQRGRGRLRQSVAESSFNAWTKFYQQDENAFNAIVSYYAKGSLIAACIDLKMRLASGGAVSLDDVMRQLWRDYLAGREGVAPGRIAALASELAGAELDGFVDRLVHGRDDAPLPELLRELGIDVELRVQGNAEDRGGKEFSGELPRASFGASLKAGADGLAILRVDEGGAAQAAGLAAGDQLLAVDGLRLDAAGIEARLRRAQAGDRWRIHAFRRDELHEFDVELAAAEPNTFVLGLGEAPGELCRAWLGLE